MRHGRRMHRLFAQAVRRSGPAGCHWESCGLTARKLLSLNRRLATGCVAQEANSFSKGNQFSQRPGLQFLHHPDAVGLDRALGSAQRVGGLLVGFASNDEFEDLPLARGQRFDTRAK